MSQLTAKCVQLLAHLEGMCLESYKDSGGVWTWALGVTNISGHEVYPRYKDTPQSLERCLEVSVWLIKNKYLPAVLRAFPDCNEAQLAAALSFHWNSGRIGRIQGDFKNALEINNHGLLFKRRLLEQKLFYEGIWPKDMRCPLYPVLKPSYQPDFRHPKEIQLGEIPL